MPIKSHLFCRGVTLNGGLMSVNVAHTGIIIGLSKGGTDMKESDKLLKSALKTLLNERLSDAEEQSLKDEGFKLSKPTRKAAVMIALYKKAASGDLSAIKELRSIVSDADKQTQTGRTVMIIDDIRGQTFADSGSGV